MTNNNSEENFESHFSDRLKWGEDVLAISVFFGIDGTDQKSLEKYRVGSNFKKVQENWRAFIKAGGKATWQFIVFEYNQHLLEQAEQMSKDEGFKNFRTIWSHREGSGEVKKEVEEEKEIQCKYGNQKRLFINHNQYSIQLIKTRKN